LKNKKADAHADGDGWGGQQLLTMKLLDLCMPE